MSSTSGIMGMNNIRRSMCTRASQCSRLFLPVVGSGRPARSARTRAAPASHLRSWLCWCTLSAPLRVQYSRRSLVDMSWWASMLQGGTTCLRAFTLRRAQPHNPHSGDCQMGTSRVRSHPIPRRYAGVCWLSRATRRNAQLLCRLWSSVIDII
jgi:hypothetical protein